MFIIQSLVFEVVITHTLILSARPDFVVLMIALNHQDIVGPEYRSLVRYKPIRGLTSLHYTPCEQRGVCEDRLSGVPLRGTEIVG